MNITNDLQHKVILITGASRGIGRACAKAFSQLGCKIVIHYNKNEKAALGVKELLNNESTLVQANLSQESGCKKLVSEAVTAFGRIDVLVINHGIWEKTEINKISADDVERTISTNLNSLFFLTRETVPFFSRETGGAIVFVSSTAGQRGEANYSLYAASKGGLIALTKSLAVELAPQKIRVNAVAPGWVNTDMTRGILKGEYLKEVEKTIPLGKVAKPEDIAPSVVFLSSGYANHITGEILNVNGGSVLCG